MVLTAPQKTKVYNSTVMKCVGCTDALRKRAQQFTLKDHDIN